MSIDASELLKSGASEMSLKHIDGVLNPKGFVVLFISLKALKNGKYKVAVSINDNASSSIFIETLVPTEPTFDPPYSLEHFRDSLTD